MVEVRQQRITSARLLVALRVPSGDEDGRPGQRGGILWFASWVAALRRKPLALSGIMPVDLVDSRLWPVCAEAGSVSQPCACRWSVRQRAWMDAGNCGPAVMFGRSAIT